MKGRQIILDHIAGREAAALMVDGRLQDVFVDNDGPRVGAILRARVDRPQKGQGGVFVATPAGPMFLRQVKGLSPGQPILVQVSGHAEPGKAPPVTDRLMFKSRYAIVTPGAPGINVSRSLKDEEARAALLDLASDTFDLAEAGLILRTSCEGADPDAVAEDIRAMTDLAAAVLADAAGPPEALTEGDGPHVLAWREWTDPAEVITAAGSFATHGVLDALAEALAPEVSLPHGHSMVIEATRALIAVDVNTGMDTSPAASLKANLNAARELPRQLRLRGLGGIVMMDLAPLPKKDRRTFEVSLKAAFRSDPVETVLAGWTPLGNFELQRHRVRLPLVDLIGADLMADMLA